MRKYRKYMISMIILLAFCVTVCFIPIDASKFIPVIEKQVSEDLGIKIHIEKLIFRFGPSLKLKSPVMHLMYEDGQKFAQFDNVKIFLPWTALFKEDVVIKRLYAKKFIAKINSNDRYLSSLAEKISAKDFEENPNILLKEYSISYNDAAISKHYKFAGKELELTKISKFKNIKVYTNGNLSINDKRYLSYDLSIEPNIEMSEQKDAKSEINVKELFAQMEKLGISSDIMADVKLYKNSNNEIQISGYVNIDSDTNCKSPKSYIYLTFWGNKIGVDSNIFGLSTEKVSINGVINASKKPEIDLKVKTDKIDIADIFPKIKLWVDCSKLKGINSLAGNLNADFTLKGDLNKIRSSGYLKISDAVIKSDTVDVNKINADIDFSNNVINISNGIGYVNNAPIMIKGKIDKAIDLELLMNKVELKHCCPKYIGINGGILSLSAKINGTFDNIIHKENIQVEKFSALKNKNSIKFESLKIDTNKDNTAYINNLTVKPEQTSEIKIPQIKLNIANDVIKIPETNIFMPNSKIKAKAEITNYNTNNYNFSLNLNGFVNSKDINVSVPAHASYPIKANLSGSKYIQNIETQVLLEKAQILDEPAIINLVSKIENGNVKIEDLSISSFSGNFSNNLKSNLKGQKKL